MFRRIALVPALLAGMATLGLAGVSSPANALVGGKSGLDNRTPISETANAGVTEVGRRRGPGFKRRGFSGRSFKGRSFGRRSFGKNRGSFRKFSNRRSYRRHRYNDFGYALPLLGLGVYLGSRPDYYYYNDDYYYEGRRSYGGGRCAHWRNACADNWGYGNSDYYGCLRYHNCY